MRKRKLTYGLGAIAALGVLVLAPVSVQAAPVLFDQFLPSNIIAGDGTVADGGFTTREQGGVLLGVRTTVRYDTVNNLPQNIFNSNGNGTYSHAAGAPPSNPDRGRFNITWNVDTTSGGKKLSDFIYRIGIDYDPTAGHNYRIFDPIKGENPPGSGSGVVIWDHGIGTQATANGAGDNDLAARLVPGYYDDLLAQNEVAQNSWNLAFYDDATHPYDPNLSGLYDFFFEVRTAAGGLINRVDGRSCVGDVSCLAITQAAFDVPEPATLGLLAFGLCGLGLARRKTS